MSYIQQIILLIILSVIPQWGLADNTPSISISMECTDTDGQTSTESSFTGSAPITAKFSFTTSDDEGWDFYYEWRVCHESESLDDPYIVRKDESPEITFTQSTTDSIALYAIFTRATAAGIDTVSYLRHDIEGQNMVLTIKPITSQLTFPNAFSPNGDGKNDTFKPKTFKSIVEFHAIIVNRWGQKMYEWNDVRGEGWDGRFNGHDVKQGTYFIYCKARGADGTIFNIKKDVNLLRSYDQSVNGSSTTTP